MCAVFFIQCNFSNTTSPVSGFKIVTLKKCAHLLTMINSKYQ